MLLHGATRSGARLMQAYGVQWLRYGATRSGTDADVPYNQAKLPVPKSSFVWFNALLYMVLVAPRVPPGTASTVVPLWRLLQVWPALSATAALLAGYAHARQCPV